MTGLSFPSAAREISCSIVSRTSGCGPIPWIRARLPIKVHRLNETTGLPTAPGVTSVPCWPSASTLSANVSAPIGSKTTSDPYLPHLRVTVANCLSAQPAYRVEPLAGRSCIHLRPERPADIDRRLSGRGRGSLHQQRLALLQAAQVDDRPPGRQVRGAERRACGRAQRVRDREDVLLLRHDTISVGPVCVCHEHPFTGVLAPSGSVAAKNRRERTCAARAVSQVDVIDSDSLDPDDHLTLARERVRQVLGSQHLRAAGLVHHNRTHSHQPPFSCFATCAPSSGCTLPQ